MKPRHVNQFNNNLTFSALHTSNKRFNIWASESLVNRRTAQRLCIGSMILVETLQAKANRVVDEKSSIVRRKAC
jgi:hypothetical protein